MKYQEIENKFDRFLVDELHFRGNIELEIYGESQMLFALEPYVEKYYTKLMTADDINLRHNVFVDTKSDTFNSISAEEAEELIIKKTAFLENIKRDNSDYNNLNMSPDFVKLTNMSDAFKNELSHKVSTIIQILKEKVQEFEKGGEKLTLTIAKKIAMLYTNGFYTLPIFENKSNSFKAKVTQMLIGGSLDLITRNIKNFYVDEDEIDSKYGAIYYQKDMEKLLRKLK